MNNKIEIKYFEIWAYIVGVSILALGCTFMEKANLGISMVVAPAYLIYLKMNSIFSFFTFGMAEYTLQFTMIAVMAIIVGKFKKNYLFSIVTAVFYGVVLDMFMKIFSGVNADSMTIRIVFYVVGMFLSSFGVSLEFHTYIAPSAYDYFVREVSGHFNVNITKFKTSYDCISCAVGVLLSFLFFGFMHFEGVKWGTVICAVVNGSIIGMFSKFFESHFLCKKY